ncbi:MAG: enoyl-CoA hydratase-related protein [Acidobacteriota bacterium]|nr:enoyl-CoA hydratase-related protein [Acidobacteriota bacterium]
MTLETLGLQIADGVARITLRRPNHANAMTPTLAGELLRVTTTCELDPGVRAIVIDAEGKMFCAGGDLTAFSDAGADIRRVLRQMTVDLHGAISRLARMRVPVIAAVQGTAAGAGFSLTCACDLVLAARSSKFTMAYTKAGLVPDGSSTYFLPRIVGRRRALELMLLNPVLHADEARNLGLVTRVIDDTQLHTEAMNLARQLAEGPTGAYAAAKRLVLSSAHETLESQMELESSAIAEAAGGPDGQEGIRAFLAKRTPIFSGR